MTLDCCGLPGLLSTNCNLQRPKRCIAVTHAASLPAAGQQVAGLGTCLPQAWDRGLVGASARLLAAVVHAIDFLA